MQKLQAFEKRFRLTREDIATLAAYGVKTSWPVSFQIYQRGAKANGFSIVLRGHVILRNRMQSGRGFVPAVVTAGESFGIEGLTPDSAYVTDAHSAEETDTLFLTAVKFREVVREKPTEALKLIGQLLDERAQLLERLHELASQNVEQRVIAALSRLSRDDSFLAEDGSLRLDVRHHRLLCEMVGASRESIALALGKLVDSGMAERSEAAFFVAPSALDGHITCDGAGNGAIPVATERWRPSL